MTVLLTCLFHSPHASAVALLLTLSRWPCCLLRWGNKKKEQETDVVAYDFSTSLTSSPKLVPLANLFLWFCLWIKTNPPPCRLIPPFEAIISKERQQALIWVHPTVCVSTPACSKSKFSMAFLFDLSPCCYTNPWLNAMRSPFEINCNYLSVASWRSPLFTPA